MNATNFVSMLHHAAYVYATEYDWSIIPLGPRSKIPRTPNGVKDATTDTQQIDAWWRCCPNANIGIVTGLRSGIVGLDIDPKPDAQEILAELESKFGKLPSTPHVITGRGGFHFYFRTIESLKNRIGLFTGVDFKADEGYLVAPPSIHANGNPYVWEASHRPGELALAEMPNWLAELTKSETNRDQGKTFLRTNWPNLLKTGFCNGRRNSDLTRLAGHLFRRHVDPQIAVSLLTAFNQKFIKPPLTESELLRTIDAIAGLELRRRRGVS